MASTLVILAFPVVLLLGIVPAGLVFVGLQRLLGRDAYQPHLVSLVLAALAWILIAGGVLTWALRHLPGG